MRSFADFIAINELADLPLGGSSFTWARGSNRSRLDRFLLSGDWLAILSEVYQQALPHSVSDHCPLLLSPKMEFWGPPPFRFELAWLENPQMEALLVRWWSESVFEGPGDVVIGKKLRFIKGKLKEWDKEQKEVDQGRKRILEDRLMEINTLADSGLASAEDYEQQGRLIQEHKELLMLKKISWRQRSRVKWLLEGDKNTAFFHAMASARRRRNRIESLEVEGEIVSDKERIIEEIIEFYRSLYSADGMLRPIPQDICFASLSLEASAGLEIPFSEVEIRSALFSLEKDKAPGPDESRNVFEAPSPSPSPQSSHLFNGAPSPSPSQVQNYTYICNPQRFADLGLDISTFAFCDKSLSFDVRAKDLIDRMIVSEKVT
ncbi:uncharacterized protein LOC143853179 [Tasmannia lanceolata]|uniref:uncharacterized protein LOC143853179 n=1 Tax=Tasmannia lanceolata TaxID=3420 RepID=UPI0040628E42